MIDATNYVDKLFDSIAINPGHKLYHLLSPRQQFSYNLWGQKSYNFPHCYTERFRPFPLCHVSGLQIKFLKFQGVHFVLRLLDLFFSFTT